MCEDPTGVPSTVSLTHHSRRDHPRTLGRGDGLTETLLVGHPVALVPRWSSKVRPSVSDRGSGVEEGDPTGLVCEDFIRLE